MFEEILVYLESDYIWIWLLLAIVVEMALILVLYFYNRHKRVDDFERLYRELIKGQRLNGLDLTQNRSFTRKEIEMLFDRDDLERELYRPYNSIRFDYTYKDILRVVSRVDNSQKKMQEEFEKMNLLLSSTGVYNNLSTNQQGIDAAKLIEQIAKMTNVDYLLELMKSDRESKYIVMENVIKDISHTVKTPISGIYAILMMLKKCGIDDQTVLDCLTNIEKSLDQITDNLQAYQNLMTQTLDGEKKSNLSFSEKLSARLKVAALSSEKRLFIDSTHVDEFAFESQTASLILLALDCIIENATYFANDNSTIRVNGKLEKDYYIFQIENDGQPINEDNAKRIFEDGFSTHSSSGKGLFFVKSVIRDRLGGDVDFENIKEPEPGVRFIILLEKNKIDLQEREKEENGESNDFGG